ncbi:hypothetical protein [Phyllobacterium sp. SB3]|uniref:hypothetical protein n=1 Tax=Phyllobacterium sp. SB3 TaxID=3156073 RepID=UPI0032AEC81E
MQNDKQPYWTAGVKDPRTPVGKIKLSDLMNYDPRCSYKHKRVWEFHLGWSHADYEHTSLASVRKIYDEMTIRSPAGRSPLSLNHINLANRDLCDWGYITLLAKGTGRNASRFTVNWALLENAANGQFPSLCHPVGDANTETHLCHPIGDSTVTHVGDANDVLRNPVGDKDLSTPTRVQDPGKEVDRINDSAPALAGLAPATRAEEKEGNSFDRLWNAYGVRRKRIDAKQVFDSLPDNVDIEDVISAAKLWREAWAAQNKSDAPRKHLSTWLRDECYLEDAPTAYKPKERKPSKLKAEPANDDEPAGPWIGDVSQFAPIGTFRGEIIDATVNKLTSHNTQVILTIQLDGIAEKTVEHSFLYEAFVPEEQERGQRFVRDIQRAVGINREIEDVDELLYRPCSVTIGNRGAISYRPLKEAA